MDAAGIDAIEYINPTSIAQSREYGGYVYTNPDGTYSYQTPAKGSLDGLMMPTKPASACADYHTHGSNDPGYDNENFSRADKSTNNSANIPGYLGTPSGAIKKYDPSTMGVTQLKP